MNVFGNSLKIIIFGKSHEKYVGITLDGLPAGLKIDEESIAKYLNYRRPKPIINTSRVEEDEFEIIGGFNGFTDGAPLTILIKNKDVKSSDYDELFLKPRPGHADYPAYIKYKGFNDYRGGGQFSGRMTAPIVAAGGLLAPILENVGIRCYSRVVSIGEIKDSEEYTLEQLERRYENDLRVLSSGAYEKMMEKILAVRREGDSIGGVVETVISGLPVGLGEPFFYSLESGISALAFSIPGIKGIEFGDGFQGTLLRGSEFNDQLYLENSGKIKLKSNHSGGINGGLSNGNPVVFRVAVRPTSSIPKPQNTVNMKEMSNDILRIKGRHDPCIVPRVVPIMESVANIAITDFLLTFNGGESIGKS
jgi:chorismate synthase